MSKNELFIFKSTTSSIKQLKFNHHLCCVMIKLAIIEDSKALRENYTDYFTIRGNFQILWTSDDIEEVIKTELIHPDVILLDINLLGTNAVDGFHSLKNKFPKSYIVILTAFDSLDYVKSLVRKGVNGYILKSISLADIYSSILNLIEEEFSISPKISHQILTITDNQTNNLTKREVEILKLIAEGHSHKEASDKLLISNYTINQHLKNIYKKLGVHSKKELIQKVVAYHD